jgi:catalase (peroxidase I)
MTHEPGREVNDMRNQIMKMAMSLMITGALVGGGTAVAHAAGATPSAKASSSASTTASSSNTTTDNCPVR